MKRMKIAAALILAACFTVLPAYSLAAAYRAGHITAGSVQQNVCLLYTSPSPRDTR